MRDFIKSTLEREGLKPPAQPTNLRAGGVTGSQIEIQWQENATNEANIFVAATVMGTDRWMYYRFGANTAGKTFKAPSAGPYLFAVMACNDSGCSDWSNVIEVTTARQ